MCHSIKEVQLLSKKNIDKNFGSVDNFFNEYYKRIVTATLENFRRIRGSLPVISLSLPSKCCFEISYY